MEYNPYSGVIQTDPYPTYRWMRDEAPCLYNEQRDFYALSRHADVLRSHEPPPRSRRREKTRCEEAHGVR